MTVLINITVALFLIGIALSCLKRPTKHFSKQERFLLFLLATGLFQVGGASFAGLNFSALRLLVWIILLTYVLFTFKSTKNRPTKSSLNLPILFYGLFLSWCALHLIVFSPSLNYGIRAILKLIYPFLILLLAKRITITEKVPIYLHRIFAATIIISIFISGISEKIPYLTYNPLLTRIFWGRATFADHAAIMIGVGLSLWISNVAGRPLFPHPQNNVGIRHKKHLKKIKRYYKNWQYKVAILWLCLSPIPVANRTGLLATCASIATFLAYRYRIKALPVLIAIFFLGVSIVLYDPSFRDSTFRGNQGVTFQNVQQVDSSEIDSSGRFAMWDYLMNRFFYPNPIMGAGLGATQQFMYTMADIPGGGPFGKIKVPHSDYVVLLCDLGLIGFSLYMLAGISALFIGFVAVFKKNKEEKMLGLVVASSFMALFCAMGFDNPHLYALGVHQYPFAFLG